MTDGKRTFGLTILFFTILLLVGGCGRDDGDDPKDQPAGRTGHSAEADLPDRYDASPFDKVDNEYSQLFHKIYRRLLTGSVIVDGDDLEDYGDAMAYSCALIYTLKMQGLATDEELAFADNLAEGYRRQVAGFVENPLSIVTDSNLAMEAYIGVLGLLVGLEAGVDPTYLETIDDYFDAMFKLIDLLGTTIYYLPIPPYGPVTITSGLAGTLLHYPLAAAGGGRSKERLEQGLTLLEEMDETVWDEGLGTYRIMAWDRHAYLYQYSNVTAIQALVRAHHLTGEQAYLTRAVTIIESLEGLFSPEYGGYFASDESYRQAPHHGEEYIALSGQNYTIFADLLLYQFTGDEIHQERALRLFDFAEKKLFIQHERLCYHDLQHGVLADWYCTGCNWQLLYNILILDLVRAGVDLLPPVPAG